MVVYKDLDFLATAAGGRAWRQGFGHGITKPKQQCAVMEENEKWFAQYIWGEKPEEPKPAEAKNDEKKTN